MEALIMSNSNKYERNFGSSSTTSPFANYNASRLRKMGNELLPSTPAKKLCFNFFRGCCTFTSDVCEYHHPTTIKEFNEDLERLSKIDCKYGDTCPVVCCLYKHRNKESFVPKFRPNTFSPTEISANDLKNKPRLQFPSTLQTKNEIKESSDFDDSEVDHLMITFRQVSGLGISDRVKVPDEVKLFLDNQPKDISNMSLSGCDDTELFSIINLNSCLASTVVFDLRFQSPSSFPKLLNQIRRISNMKQLNEVWITISSDVSLTGSLEKVFEKSSLDFALGQVKLDNRLINCYNVELKTQNTKL